jgi:signal transduction histidine kinase/DNA-binding response OmpR family regulator
MDKDHYRILLIEDDEDDYFLVKSFLSEARSAIYHLDWASNYEQGLSYLCGTGYDACLLDYLLGARDGLELLREAIGRDCAVPIILLTGQGNEDLDLEALRAGAADYLVKGLISKELLERSIRYSIAHKRAETNLRKRTAELALANEALRLDEMRLRALGALRQMHGASEKIIANFILDRLVRITGSKFGMFGFMNEKESVLTFHSWPKRVLRECVFQQTHLPVKEAGIWAEAVTGRQPVIINHYEIAVSSLARCPLGYVPIHRVMSVPFFNGERIVAVATTVNKDVDYDESDVRRASLLLDGMWRHIERERVEKALRGSESLAAMGMALSSVAHDIKIPLLAIGGFAKMVQRNLPQGSRDRHRLDIVLKETDRLEKMVKDMLDFSRPLEIQKFPEDACGMVRETLSIVNSAAEAKEVSLAANLRQCDSPVPMDGPRMKQVLINLISNAIQASPKGKTVMVNLYRQKREIIFEVVDCGSGIPLDRRSEIFTPFFTTRKEGTGLGLPIVKKIVDAHKGCVEVLDNPDAGMTFRVVLPIAA